MSKRTDLAIETLTNGGFFFGSSGYDYWGKAIVKIVLRTADRKTVKGVGAATLYELIAANKIRYCEHGEYVNAAEIVNKYRGVIYGKYELIA